MRFEKSWKSDIVAALLFGIVIRYTMKYGDPILLEQDHVGITTEG